MSSKISVRQHNGNASEFTVGGKTWYFSYQTCVAFEDLENHRRIRRDQNYSVTTAKHMGFMGVKDWRKVDDATFDHIATA